MENFDITADVGLLAAKLVDLESVSGNERAIADGIERALRPLSWLRIVREGEALVASSNFGHDSRVMFAGHVDTVPLPQKTGALGGIPSRWAQTGGQEVLYGRGTTDMKAGVAVQLALASCSKDFRRDVSFVFYDNEEVEAEKSGLARLIRRRRELLTADLAILLEPTDGIVEAGCNGSLRCEVVVAGEAAHAARSWMGHNAIHAAHELLARLRTYTAQTVLVDGLAYREGLNAVRIRGGVAGNVIPDRVVVEVNYRFAPDKTLSEAKQVLREMFAAWEVRILDASPAAAPGLDDPLIQDCVDALGGEIHPKMGWTDVARLAALGIPAMNFGPGNPLLAHSDDEHVVVEQIRRCRDQLLAWLI